MTYYTETQTPGPGRNSIITRSIVRPFRDDIENILSNPVSGETNPSDDPTAPDENDENDPDVEENDCPTRTIIFDESDKSQVNEIDDEIIINNDNLTNQ